MSFENMSLTVKGSHVKLLKDGKNERNKERKKFLTD